MLDLWIRRLVWTGRPSWWLSSLRVHLMWCLSSSSVETGSLFHRAHMCGCEVVGCWTLGVVCGGRRSAASSSRGALEVFSRSRSHRRCLGRREGSPGTGAGCVDGGNAFSLSVIFRGASPGFASSVYQPPALDGGSTRRSVWEPPGPL